jgi:hypothetical protein
VRSVKVVKYPVEGKDLSDFHDMMFGAAVAAEDSDADDAAQDADKACTGDTCGAQLCAVMKDMLGYKGKKCETAAAFTTWTIRLEPREPYAISGVKQPVAVQFEALVATPVWKHEAQAAADEAADARRFSAQTELHEHGHVASGENAAVCIAAFVNALPDAVAPVDVAPLNAAVQRVVQDFYIPAAHAADKTYDLVTDHGRVQGAEALYEVEDGAAPSIFAVPRLPKSQRRRPRPRRSRGSKK